MGLFDKLFGKKQPEPEKPEPAEQSGSMREEIQKINDRLEEIQKTMTEENKAQYRDEIKALLEHEIEVLEGSFPGKDGHHE